MPPNFEPMVETGRSTAAEAAEATITAISKPGQEGRRRRSRRMTPIVSPAMPVAAVEKPGSAAAMAVSLSASGPGSPLGKLKPSNSPIWLAKMITAMPAVKPTVTG